MYSITVLALVSFVLSFLLTPLFRNIAVRRGMLDKPDADRKFHKSPVPRVGGAPIMVAYTVAAAMLALSRLAGGHVIAGVLPFTLSLMPGLLVVFVTGLADDIFGLKPWQKLLGEVAAAVCVCGAGFHIGSIGGYVVNHWIGVPLTIVWLVVCANAVNLIDGLDGLATGIGLFATLTTLIAALMQGNYALALATAPLAGALCGFLRYNINPASIFLGDSGSLSIGFLLGCFGIIWSQKSATLLGMTAPLIALAIPLLDTTLAVARRFLRCQPVFGGDRGHIHHRLLARGFTPRRVAYVLYASAGIVAGLSLILSSASGRFGGIALVAFCAIVWLAVNYLGYEEFGAAHRMIFGGLFRRILVGNLSIGQMEAAVQAANTPDECWSALVETSRRFGFSQVSIQFNDRHICALLAEADSGDCWDLHIPLNHSGHVYLRVPMNAALPPATIGRLVTSVGTVFVDKLAAFAVHPSAASADSALRQRIPSLVAISAATTIL
jgi:UDP-GlcNAc:undecaprenyl-phosphate GlcNAc-1-phosphate transferase